MKQILNYTERKKRVLKFNQKELDNMEDILLYQHNNFTKVEAATESIQLIYNLLSYQLENYDLIGRKQYARTGNKYWLKWDGIKSFYDRKTNQFLTGLLPSVVAGIRNNGIGYEVFDQRKKPNLPANCHAGYELYDKKHGKIELYDFQKQACEDILSHKRGVAKLATGAGKTEIGIALTKALNLPTLFLTNKINLLHQTAERFQERIPSLRGKIGIIGDGEYSPNFVTIATVHTLQALIKKDAKHAVEELRRFQFLIIDEAHRSGSNQFYGTANCCINAYLRIGLTATPFMNNNTEEDLYLRGITGNQIVNVTNAKLIERGILAQPYFLFLNIKYPDNIGSITDYDTAYERGIVNNEYRNSIIVDKVGEIKEKYKPLVVVYKLRHGENLLRQFDANGIKAEFISGSNSYAERKKALDMLSKKKIDVIIATNIFDEGIDVKEINCVILAAGNKSAPAFFQRAGRAMRKKTENNHALIIDFIDMTNDKLFQHSKMRFDYVKNESGFIKLN